MDGLESEGGRGDCVRALNLRGGVCVCVCVGAD